MKINLNNQTIERTPPLSVRQLMEEKQWLNKSGIAVALNSVVLPRDNWETTQLKENDTLMIITATAGG